MLLFSRDFGGDGVGIILLHGMFGSSKNWVRVGQFLSSYGRCYALDLRNHGESPHAESHSLYDLIDDLREWVDAHRMHRPILVGHSMGGLAAMGYSLANAAEVRALVVVDIAPKRYVPSHAREFDALRLDVTSFSSRQEIDDRMAEIISDPSVRRFLQMNIERTETGFRWKINVNALERSTVLTDVPSLRGQYRGMVLFVAGDRSGYVDESDHATIRRYFPNARIVTISGGDHWLHYSAAEEFKETVGRFVARVTGIRQ